jgi:hypothetical protein
MDEADFRKLAEETAAELGLTPVPAWDSGWHSGAHLMADNGTGWSLSYPGGYRAKGMTQLGPIWPGGHAPPGSGGIRAGITATRGPQIVAARIRRLAPDYRAALAQLAASQAQDAARQARREQLAAQIAALIPDDSPEPDPRHPRVSVSGYGATTEVHIASAGTARFSLGAEEIELERFRAPANVVLAMLAAYAQTPREPAPLEVGPAADYTHELRAPEPAEPRRSRADVTTLAEQGLRVLTAQIAQEDRQRAPRVVRGLAANARPELIAGARQLLAGLGKLPEEIPGNIPVRE